MNTITKFYTDKPLFGLDIGFNSAKVMQINQGHEPRISGYGVINFDQAAIKDGVIIDHEKLAKALHGLFSNHIIGDITSRRVAFSVSAARTFMRILTLPKLDNKKDFNEAVYAEAEQYIPAAITDLYLDFDIIGEREKETDVLVVAVPKKIIESYMQLANILGLEVAAMETTIGAIARLFSYTPQHDVPTILIDFGSVSSDITIYDNGIVVTGTVPGGGDDFTHQISDKLSVTKEEANIIKVKYGLGVSKKQKQIKEALTAQLELMVKEVQRMVRYYEEHVDDKKKKIGQIVTLGGGANVPGLSEYLTDTLRLPVRMCNPWQTIQFKGTKAPNPIEQSMYITVAGLALMNPRELFE